MPALAANLAAEAINPLADPLRRLEPQDLATADVVVVFNEPVPGSGLEQARDWSDLGSMNTDYITTRDDLLGRIDRLLDELSRS